MLRTIVRSTAALIGAVFAAAATAASGSADSGAALHAQVEAAKAKLVAHLQAIGPRLQAVPGMFSRLDSDDSFAYATTRPDWMSETDFWSLGALEIRLDSSLVDQLVSGAPHDLAKTRGADDVIFVSNADHAVQPLAVYVPASYDPSKPASLAVILHGATENENDMIAPLGFRQLADATGTVLAAPFARGDSNYADPAPADIYQVVGMMERAFTIDPTHVYLVGYSMGGFGVFKVGPREPAAWTGFLSIAGGISSADQAGLRALRGRRLYIVAGANDDNIGVEPSRLAVLELQASGIEVHYYEVPDGTHALHTLFPSIAKAWVDMFARRGPKPSVTPTPAPLNNAVPIAPPTMPPLGQPLPRGTPPARP